MKCLPIPNGVVCYADVMDAEVTDRNGKVWRFDFDPWFGPLVVTKHGNPVANQPVERSAFWPAFQVWHDAREGLPPKCSRCAGSGAVEVARISRRASVAAKCPDCNGSGRASQREDGGREDVSDPWAILQGDCREVMRSLEPESVDAVVTDPPYGTTSYGWDRRVRGWLAELPRLLRPHGSVWMFGSLRSLLAVAPEIAEGWVVMEDVIWEKQNGSGVAADRFRRVHEQAVRLYPKGRPAAGIYSTPPVTLDARKRSVYRREGPGQWGAIGAHRYESEEGGPRLMRSVIYARSCHRRGIKHGTPKPEEILQPLIEEATPAGGTVLDPFCGSGATGRAALLCGRRFIGIEVEAGHIAEAQRVPAQVGLLSARVPSSSEGGER